MNIYLVGGAVRDDLLGLPVQERDWVVVGSTPQAMLNQGYQPVGKDFPVFLHPETKEEYALARIERKTAPGYTGFEFNTAPCVTLEEDLSRRDLTINAIAKDQAGNLIDPFNGQADIKKKLLRHVSPAFVEDPVRLLRVARFAARFPEFSVAEETVALMKVMVKNGEVDSLVPERVWQELFKALNSLKPSRFFAVLRQCDALKIIFPELTYNKQAEFALEQATQFIQQPLIRFAALTHQSLKIKSLCEHLKVPKEFMQLSLLVASFYQQVSQLTANQTDELLALLEKTDAFRRPQRFKQFALAASACMQLETANKQYKLLLNSLEICLPVSTKDIDSNLTGRAIADAIHQIRLKALKEHLYEWFISYYPTN